MKPLIKWSGSKQDELIEIRKYLPENYETYIEPFFGGGSLFFDLQPKHSIIADIHLELINFYRQIKNSKSNEIFDFMEKHQNTEEIYYQVRDNPELIQNEVDEASRFYYLRKTCFRGMMRYNKKGKFNIPFGRYKTVNYTALLEPEYQSVLKNTEILKKDFSYVFENYNDERNFVFLDPPYDSPFKKYFTDFDRDDQRKIK